MQTFLFYDTETSGLNPAFDQVLTFACIRTDLQLNEIERETITVQLREDIIPSPGAFLTHGLAYDELCSGVIEYEAARKIHSQLNRPGTISVGYNSLGFDDEFLRFLFYRNLLDPYSHQYANGCSRMDILPIAVIYRVFHPDGVKWPQIDGKPSLKLELISSENHFVTSGRAHEAMADVEALVALSKCLTKNKKIWDYCLEFFNKTRDEVRINTMETSTDLPFGRYPLCLMASASVGPDNNYLAPVLHLGASTAFKNQNLWLRLDSDDILGIPSNSPLEETFVVRKRYGDIPVILPAIERFWDRLTDESKVLTEKNLKIIGENQPRFESFRAYHCAFKYPFVPGVDIDAALYQDGFFSAQEKKESRVFHQTDDNRKITIAGQLNSPRIQKLVYRILSRNFKHLSGSFDSTDYAEHLSGILSGDGAHQVLGYRGDVKYDCEVAMSELADMKEKIPNPDADQKTMIDWLSTYITEKMV